MNQIDLPTWLKLTNTKGLEAIVLTEIIDLTHDNQVLQLIQLWFFWFCTTPLWF